MAGKFVLKRSGDQFMFNLKAGNGQTIATSERYTTKQGALNGIESVTSNAPGASIEDQTYFGGRSIRGVPVRWAALRRCTAGS